MTKGVDHIGIAVVYFCHDGKGKLLMHKRSQAARDEHGCWDVGGGAVEFGHSAGQTLKKEILEEYNTKILAFEFLGYRDDVFRQYQGRPTHWVTLDFKVLVDPKLVKNNEPHKFEELGWFTLNALPSPLHSQLPLFLKKYQDKLA